MTTTNDHFPKDWQLILFAAIIFFLAMQSCTTTRQVHQELAKEESLVKVSEETKANMATEIKTEINTTAETEVNESFDTVVRIWPVVDGKVSEKPVDVLVKGERTIHRKEFSNQQQQRNEQSNIEVSLNDQRNQKSEVVLKQKTVERTPLPWWGILIIFVFILFAIIAFLIKRVKGTTG